MNVLFAVRSYRFKVDVGAVVLCAFALLPTLLWWIQPVSVRELGNVSCTPVVDDIGMAFQSVMMAALCLLDNRQAQYRLDCMVRSGVVGMLLLYYTAWVFVYIGVFDALIVLLLSFPPCMAFVLYAWGRRNGLALLSSVAFLCCHVFSCIVNFI